MSNSKQLKAKDIANVASCSTRAIYRIKKNLRRYGSTKAPLNSGGRPRSITPPMLDALCEHLRVKPELYLHEMVDWVWNNFQVDVTIFSIRRALISRGLSDKKKGRVAKARDADLRDLYLHNTSHIRSRRALNPWESRIIIVVENHQPLLIDRLRQPLPDILDCHIFILLISHSLMFYLA